MTAADFAWAVGIEDTFIGQPHRRTGRTLDEYELQQHYRFWRDDLERIASLGVRRMRYGIPWYRVNPAPGRFDWSWTDQVIPYLVDDLGIEPIVDLMHYGCPLWLEQAFVDPGYPELVAEYAASFAERYRRLLRFYTPLNEPIVNAWFCGRSGAWPPYLRGPAGYVRVLLAIVRGMVRTIEALRRVRPDVVIVQVEASARVLVDPGLEDRYATDIAQQFLPTDLMLGRVDEAHPMRPWLLTHEATVEELDALAEASRAARIGIDVMGINFYPHLSTARLTGTPEAPIRRHTYASADDLTSVLRDYHEHFGVPVMITETSDLARVSRRESWLETSVEAVRGARAGGVPVVGYTWFPVYSHLSWDYRAGRRPPEAYWCHMGLWELHEDGAGVLVRQPTRLVDRYRQLVAAGASAVGPLIYDISQAENVPGAIASTALN